jgi:hypothetical protein
MVIRHSCTYLISLLFRTNGAVSNTQVYYFFKWAHSINEYEGRTVPCSDDVTIGISASSGVCPLPGEEVISSFGIHGINQNFWFNVLMMIALQVVFRLGAYAVLRRSK